MMDEKDYAAIEEAVLATARGRWFLKEYARRIRAAETDRILAAIATLAAAAPAQSAEPPPSADPFTAALRDIEALPLAERLKLTG